MARAEVREGEQLISAALEQLRQLGTSGCSDAELVQKFSEIRQRAAESGNKYIQCLTVSRDYDSRILSSRTQ